MRRLPIRLRPASAALAAALALLGPSAAAPMRAEAAAPTTTPTSTPTSTPTPTSASTPAATPAGVYVADLAAKLGARLSYDPLTGYCLIERSGSRAALAAGLPWALFDWDRKLSFDPPSQAAGGLALTAKAASVLEKAFADAAAEARSRFSVAAILIDPGHGGKDPGAIGERTVGGKKAKILEKEVTLAVGKMLYASLKARYPERMVLITREDDRYPTLEDRVAMANSVDLEPNEAIIYVSIHANSSFNKDAKGFEVWYLNPDYRRTLVEPGAAGGPGQDVSSILNDMLEEEFTTESVMLAKGISSGMQAKVGADSPSRGIRADEWFVVRNARMPSVLVETGFLSNADEARLLGQDDYLRRLADGIYNGIVDFVGYFESMRGDDSQ
jgi:N-acetylmuramoyl-L-alanine amidase